MGPISLGFAQGGELRENGVQKEAEPDALSVTGSADPVHAVVPVAAANQRQAVGAGRQAFVDGTQTMLEHRSLFAGDARQQIRLLRACGER